MMIVPSAIGRHSVSTLPTDDNVCTGFAAASWSTGLTSLLIRIDLVSSLMERRSLPAIKGAASIDHKLICVRYSSPVIPPLPISSISGSFQCPGRILDEIAIWLNPMRSIDSHLSLMSPVVRQRFPPVSEPHFHGSFSPYWQR